MNKTVVEDWEFTITVISGRDCRMGFEPGDVFTCRYECPSGFCPKSMPALHTLCEVARSGGDYRLLGGPSKDRILFTCADGIIKFQLDARQIET